MHSPHLMLPIKPKQEPGFGPMSPSSSMSGGQLSRPLISTPPRPMSTHTPGMMPTGPSHQQQHSNSTPGWYIFFFFKSVFIRSALSSCAVSPPRLASVSLQSVFSSCLCSALGQASSCPHLLMLSTHLCHCHPLDILKNCL